MADEGAIARFQREAIEAHARGDASAERQALDEIYLIERNADQDAPSDLR